MMQIASDKHCWLEDLDEIPGTELNLWVAYYQLEEEKREREQQRREADGKR